MILKVKTFSKIYYVTSQVVYHTVDDNSPFYTVLDSELVTTFSDHMRKRITTYECCKHNSKSGIFLHIEKNELSLIW